MNIIELKDKVQAVLPEWNVTANEAYMLNVEADQLEQGALFAYVEEFITWNSNRAGYGKKETARYEITFCKLLSEFQMTAEDRIAIRQDELMPGVRAVEQMIFEEYGVKNFNYDVYPRGFDANEVLVHMTFSTEETIC